MFCGGCGSEFPDDFSFCPKCGRSVHTNTLPEGPHAVAAPPALEAEQDRKNPKSAPSAPVKARFNYGTVVFAAFSVLSLLICLAKGIVPIYLGESALWAAVAWYWHKKSPWSEAATGIVLLLAVGVAAGEGYLLGWQSLEKHYAAVAPSAALSVAPSDNPLDAIFGKPTDVTRIPLDEAARIGLSNGAWEEGYFLGSPLGSICFDIQNNSQYLLRWVSIKIHKEQNPESDDEVQLFKESNHVLGGFLNVGETQRFCGPEKRSSLTGKKWSYSIVEMYGIR